MRLLSFSILTGVVLTMGCGDDGRGTPATTADSGAAARQDAAADSGSDAGTVEADGGASADTGAGDAGIADAATPDDAGAVDAGSNADAGIVGTPGAIACGSTSCDLSRDVCCIGLTGANCTSENDCRGLTAKQFCDGAEDCGSGQACCALFEGIGGMNGAFCLPDAECDTTSVSEAEICQADSQCRDVGETCITCEFPGGQSANVCATSCPN